MTTAIVIGLVLAAAGVAIYLFREKLFGLTKDDDPLREKLGLDSPSVPPPLPGPQIVEPVRVEETGEGTTSSGPLPPLVDAPIVREDDTSVDTPGRDEFGGPTRWPDLLEVTPAQILAYVPGFRFISRYARYFIDPSLEGSKQKSARLSPGLLLGARAKWEADRAEIQTFDHGLFGHGKSRRVVIQEWIAANLTPKLRPGEFETLVGDVGVTTSKMPGHIARLRAREAAPDWLAQFFNNEEEG